MSDSKTNINTGTKMHMANYRGAFNKDGKIVIRRRNTGTPQTACKRWISGMSFGEFSDWVDRPDGCAHCKKEWKRIMGEVKNLKANV